MLPPPFFNTHTEFCLTTFYKLRDLAWEDPGPNHKGPPDPSAHGLEAEKGNTVQSAGKVSLIHSRPCLVLDRGCDFGSIPCWEWVLTPEICQMYQGSTLSCQDLWTVLEGMAEPWKEESS